MTTTAAFSLQNVLEIAGMQMPLVSPSRAGLMLPSPFENPGPGEKRWCC